MPKNRGTSSRFVSFIFAKKKKKIEARFIWSISLFLSSVLASIRRGSLSFYLSPFHLHSPKRPQLLNCARNTTCLSRNKAMTSIIVQVSSWWNFKWTSQQSVLIRRTQAWMYNCKITSRLANEESRTKAQGSSCENVESSQTQESAKEKYNFGSFYSKTCIWNN